MKSPAIVCSFSNIRPINTVREGINRGHYYDWYNFINSVRTPLIQVEGKKTLHVVCFSRPVGKTEYSELLREEEKRPCRDAPNYLLGLMAHVREEEMPIEFRNIDIIAAEPDNPSSVFIGAGGNLFFLSVGRRVNRRMLRLAPVNWGWEANRAFLAEDLIP